MRVRKLAGVILTLLLMFGILTSTLVTAADMPYKAVLTKVLDWIEANTVEPTVDSVGGEWAVLSLARGGRISENTKSAYLAKLEAFILDDSIFSTVNYNKETGKVILHPQKYTENERVILALSSLGIDAGNWKGYDFITALTDKQANGDYQAAWQGVNGSIFALIALDSYSYLEDIPGLRGWYLSDMRDKQSDDGGWGVAGFTGPDLTAMGLSALAPYYKLGEMGYNALELISSPTYADISKMVDLALASLINCQGLEGGFGDLESTAQVVVALTALDIDPTTDPRFLKENNNPLTAMLSYAQPDGSFKHTYDGSGNSQMSTEQAAYALVAYDRFVNNHNRLYDMSDVFTDKIVIEAATTVIESNEMWDVSMDSANDTSSVEVWLNSEVDKIISNSVSFDIFVNKVKPAKEGTILLRSGENGVFHATVKLSKGKEQTSVLINGIIKPQRYVSSDTSLKSVMVGDKLGIIEDNHITVVLDYTDDALLPTDARQIIIEQYQDDARISVPEMSDDGRTWTFAITAENGTEEYYTITLRIADSSEESAKTDVEAVKSAVLNHSFIVRGNTEGEWTKLEAWIDGEIEKLNPSGITTAVTVIDFEPAVDGTIDNADGIEGSFTFTVEFSQDYTIDEVVYTITETLTHKTGVIAATPYVFSDETGVASVGVGDIYAYADSDNPYNYTVTFVSGTEITADNINIAVLCEKAQVGGEVSLDGGGIWIFDVTAEDGTVARYIITVIYSADKASLGAMIEHAEGLRQVDYTNATWMGLQKALAVAKAILSDEDASPGAVDSAKEALSTAIDNLRNPSAGTGGGWTTDNLNVTFRLIGAKKSSGDISLTNGDYKGADYVTWIATKRYSMNEGETVLDLFIKAIGDAGLTALGHEKNYVKTIYAPSSLGGYALSEFGNGKYSGWMYTIQGKHPGYGLQEQELSDGDNVVWHYVNDYRHEVEDWFDDQNYPALGDGTFWNKWLNAPDINPPKSGSSTLSGSSGADVDDETTTVEEAEAENLESVEENLLINEVDETDETDETDEMDERSSEQEWDNPFDDVFLEDWFYGAVKYVSENGIMQGMSRDLFSPNTDVTRAMFIAMLYNYNGSEQSNFKNPFSDVGDEDWYTEAVVWGVERGLVFGFGNDFFGPEEGLTREQIAVILHRFAQMSGVEVSQYADISGYSDKILISNWALDAVEWAYGFKIMHGRNETEFAPIEGVFNSD